MSARRKDGWNVLYTGEVRTLFDEHNFPPFLSYKNYYIPAVTTTILAVSYTHLDVYKRQHTHTHTHTHTVCESETEREDKKTHFFVNCIMQFTT